MTLCEKAYPRKLAFSYLTDLQKEFEERYLKQMDRQTKPYPFIKFGASTPLSPSVGFC